LGNGRRPPAEARARVSADPRRDVIRDVDGTPAPKSKVVVPAFAPAPAPARESAVDPKPAAMTPAPRKPAAAKAGTLAKKPTVKAPAKDPVAKPAAKQPAVKPTAKKPAAKPAAKKPTASAARSRAKATPPGEATLETTAAAAANGDGPVKKPRARATRKPAGPTVG
jgi:hypothetical protein